MKAMSANNFLSARLRSSRKNRLASFVERVMASMGLNLYRAKSPAAAVRSRLDVSAKRAWVSQSSFELNSQREFYCGIRLREHWAPWSMGVLLPLVEGGGGPRSNRCAFRSMRAQRHSAFSAERREIGPMRSTTRHTCLRVGQRA